MTPPVWQGHFDQLIPEIVECIGGWMPKIDAVLKGRRHLPRPDRAGAVDGVDGLTSRGHYEQLLWTEWALADAHPEEFLRRAVQGEQLYLRRARTQQVETPDLVVYVDVGPRQLGRCRLVQIALLHWFAARVEAAGGVMSVFTLSNPTRVVHSPFELLTQRSTVWRESVPERLDERPVVVLGGVAPGVWSVDVEETEAGIEVRCDDRFVVLDAPDLADAVQWLSRPRSWRPDFQHPTTLPRVCAAAALSTRLVLRHGEAVTCWAVPTVPRASPRCVRTWGVGTAEGPLVAVGWRRKSFFCIRLSDGKLRAYGFDGMPSVWAPPEFQLPGLEVVSVAIALPRRTRAGEDQSAMLVRDGSDQLWLLDFLAQSVVRVDEAKAGPHRNRELISWIRPDGECVILHLGDGDGLPGRRDYVRTTVAVGPSPVLMHGEHLLSREEEHTRIWRVRLSSRQQVECVDERLVRGTAIGVGSSRSVIVEREGRFHVTSLHGQSRLSPVPVEPMRKWTFVVHGQVVQIRADDQVSIWSLSHPEPLVLFLPAANL